MVYTTHYDIYQDCIFQPVEKNAVNKWRSLGQDAEQLLM
jgi:hypothetical protein